MTPEQLKWTDEQWATHLGCAVQQVPAIRAFVLKNYFPALAQNKETGKYVFFMSRLETTIAGSDRLMPLLSSDKEFSDKNIAMKHANETIIPSLEFKPMVARVLGMPQRALQMLHIKKKKK